MMDFKTQQVGQKIRLLRERSGISIRQLAKIAGVTAGMISCIERQKSSPSIYTLQKILTALGTDLGAFFAEGIDHQNGPVFLREQMRVVTDAVRSYTLIFPKSENIKVEILDEQHTPSAHVPELEKFQCDVAGYVIDGQIILEVEGQPSRTLRPGDAFYVPGNTIHRGYAVGDRTARVITVYSPAKY
jgi:transcriptional regulator with XRE-family HTH domain